MSSLRCPPVLPRPACAENGSQNCQELPQAGGQGNPFGFTRCTEPVIECPDHRIATGSHYGRHLSGRPHMSPSAPDRAFPSDGDAVSVERCDPNQGGVLLTAQDAELRQTGAQGGGQDRPDSGYALQQFVLLPPQGT